MGNKYANYTEKELEELFDSIYENNFEIMPPEESLDYYELNAELMSATMLESIEILENYIENNKED